MMIGWVQSASELIAFQQELAALRPGPWHLPDPLSAIAGCFVCFRRGGSGPGQGGEPGWAAAALGSEVVVVAGSAGSAYRPGLLALREGPLLEQAIRALGHRPDVLLVNATGGDHPRRAGLALHLGAVLEIPSVGVTHRPLLARGSEPGPERGAVSPLQVGDELVGYWLRTRAGARPLAVHAAWRTSPEVAVAVVLASTAGVRTPEPIRRARRAAREARPVFPVATPT